MCEIIMSEWVDINLSQATQAVMHDWNEMDWKKLNPKKQNTYIRKLFTL